MNPTPVPTAQQSPITRKTANTDIAPTATYGTPQRIDEFIKRKLAEAESAAGSGISDSADRAVRLGFVNCANSRYSEFLAAFRSSSHLTETYRERYPSSLFLPWAALHAVIKALDLWLELPEHYMGAVPPEQLPWLEIFELDPNDTVAAEDLDGLLPGLNAEHSRLLQLAICRVFHDFDTMYRRAEAWSSSSEIQRAITQSERLSRSVRDLWRSARNSFFVVAPKEAFSTTEDFLSRLRRLATEAVTETTIAPDDPLVIRFCRGGCLVVAAWGDEAAELNRLTREANL